MICPAEDAGFYLLNLIFCVTVFLTNAGEDQTRFEQGSVDRYDSGKTQLTQIQTYSNQPRYGKCWTSALASLQEGCKQLTEEEQGRMALSFANCHLEKAALDTYPCSEDQSLTDCLHRMKGDIIAFQSYTEFFTHTQDICFFLQSQVWHENTENTVSRLARSSEEVADQLDISRQRQEEMIVKQNISLEQQEAILKNEGKLWDAMQESAKELENVFDEMKQNTENQKAQLDATFDRITQVQRVILGEFTWFNSFLFYGLSVLISYLLTSTPRTSSARLLMFGVLALDWCVERMIFSVTDSSDQELVYDRMWSCRKLFCFLAILVLLICSYCYKDLSHMNYKLLLDIKRQNSELRHKLERQSLPTNIMAALKSSSHPMLAMGAPASTQVMNYQPALRMAHDMADSGGETEPAGLGAYSSDDGTNSDGDHTYTPEITYIPDQDDSDSSDISYTTAEPSNRRTSGQPSRVTTPTPDEQVSSGYASVSTDASLNRSSLFNLSAINRSAFLAPSSSDGGGSSTEKRKRGRPKGSTNRSNRSSRESTPRNNSFTSPYNLRNRQGIYSPNPLVNTEDVRTFIKHVETYQQRNNTVHTAEPVQAPSRRSQARKGPQRRAPSTAPGFFSSDDEM